MTGVLVFAITAALAIMCALAAFLALEVAGAFAPVKPRNRAARPARLAVIIPAHNEEAVIAATLGDVMAQLTADDEALVVADNCSDATAEAARRAGARVIERTNRDDIGKGFALQFGLDAIRERPPAAVVFVDADCRLGAGVLDRVASIAVAEQRPAQALYLMHAPEGAPLGRRVAEFAWLMMNRVRMAGLYAIFGATRITGAGMALPWTLAAQLDLGSGEIVEDQYLTLRMVKDRTAPILVSDALVTSEFPDADAAAAIQHARWEHGSLRFAARHVAGMAATAIRTGNLALAALALDFAIPPLTVFAMVLAGGLALGLAALFLGTTAPLILAVTAAGLFAAAVLAAWARFGQSVLPVRRLGDVAGYVAGKNAVYDEKARRSTQSWTRTERAKERPQETAGEGAQERAETPPDPGVKR